VTRSSLLAVAASASICAYAQHVTVIPSPAETTDPVVLQADVGRPVCPTPANDGLRMDGQTIRVSLVRNAVACELMAVAQARVTLGRFPAGDYIVEVSLLPPPGSLAPVQLVGTTALHVNPYDASQQLRPNENLTGHWMTGVVGEALTVTQSGAKAVASLLTYAPDGKATWYFIPDFTWRNDPARGPQFQGTVYAMQGAASMPFGVLQSITGVGTATLSGALASNGGAMLRILLAGQPPIDRTLTRLPF